MSVSSPSSKLQSLSAASQLHLDSCNRKLVWVHWCEQERGEIVERKRRRDFDDLAGRCRSLWVESSVRSYWLTRLNSYKWIRQRQQVKCCECEWLSSNASPDLLLQMVVHHFQVSCTDPKCIVFTINFTLTSPTCWCKFSECDTCMSPKDKTVLWCNMTDRPKKTNRSYT